MVKSFWISCALIGFLVSMYASADEAKPEASPKTVSSSDASFRVHIRSLAASCVVCHGNNGEKGDASKIVGLAGINIHAFITALQAYKDGKRSATVMHHHAKGLTAPEIDALASYFSALTPRPSVTLPHQVLAEPHAN